MGQAFDFIQETEQLANSIDEASTPAWFSDFRRKRIAELSGYSVPTRKTEAFKYNNLTVLSQRSFSKWVQENIQDIDDSVLGGHPDKEKLVLVDGHYSEAYSTICDSRLTPFSRANDEQQAFLMEYLDRGSNSVQQGSFIKKANKNLFGLMNDALTRDGLLIDIDSSVNSKGLQIIYLSTASAEASTAISNLVIRIKENSQIQIVEQSISHGEFSTENLLNQSTQCILQRGAILNHSQLHLEHEKTVLFARFNCWLEQDAQLNSFHIGLGGKIKRNDINIYHQAPGSNAKLSGLYLSNGDQQIDYHTNVEHRSERCSTQENFRGVVGGASKAVFNGKIHIFEGAQKTKAFMNNRNLLVSERAEVYTKPELEIYADDVECAHGATVAQMDSEMLFYLQSRGISETKARLLLSFGFINELLNEVEDEAVREYLNTVIEQFFAEVINS